jgi:hypothetical protein
MTGVQQFEITPKEFPNFSPGLEQPWGLVSFSDATRMCGLW